MTEQTALELIAPATELAALYDGKPKIVVHETASLDELAGALAGHVTVLRLRYDEESQTVRLSPRSRGGGPAARQKPGEGVEPLAALPTNIVGLWAFNRSQETALRALSEWAEARYGRPLLGVELGDVWGLARQLFDAAWARGAEFERRSAELNDALAEIRIEYEETRQVLYRMQGLLWNIHDHPVRQTFASKVGRRALTTRHVPDEGERVLIQPLPVRGRGFAGVDLCIAERTEAAGFLRCTVRNTATQEVYGEWVAGYDTLEPGWLNLSLPVILDANPQHLELTVEWCGPAAEGPALGLSESQLIGQPPITVGGAPLPGKTLALRAWGGFPGLRNEVLAPNVQWITDERWFEYVLPKAALASVRKAVEYPSDFEYLALRGDGTILLHPLYDREVSALVSNLLPKGAIRLEAEVSVEGNCPSPVEFALAAVAPGTDAASVNGGGKHCLATSGWTQVRKPFSKHRVTVELGRPLALAADLYLFTRVPDKGSVDYGQATFHQFIIAVGAQKGRYCAPVIETAERETARPAGERLSRPLPVATSAQVFGEERLRTVKPVLPFDVPFTHVKMIEGHKILVHPILNEVNIAVLPDCLPATAVRVTADVTVDGEQFAHPVEFALGMAIRADVASMNEITRSEWTAITTPHERKSVSLALQQRPAGAAASLYLHTRVPNGGSVDYASAYFTNIRVETDRYAA
jgi:hypothetical protein